MAPEVIACDYSCGAHYDARCDVWSIAITTIELCEGMPPHTNIHALKSMDKILRSAAPKLEDWTKNTWSKALAAFCAFCLVKDISKRPTCTAALGHAVFAALDAAAAREAMLSILKRLHPDVEKESADHEWRSSLHGKRDSAAAQEPAAAAAATAKTAMDTMDEDEAAEAMAVAASHGDSHRSTDNLAKMAELTERLMGTTLQARFADDVIYTRVGDILLACNPFRSIAACVAHPGSRSFWRTLSATFCANLFNEVFYKRAGFAFGRS
jgi:serine/threonine protein kinase